MEYALIDRNKKYLDAIISAAKKSSEIYLATDPDREGEAISWHIVEVLKTKKITADKKWSLAVLADGKYITKYARSNRGEDVADTISFWVAVRCVEQFSQKKKEKILKAIPNRIKFLDDFVKDNKLNTSPMICN